MTFFGNFPAAPCLIGSLRKFVLKIESWLKIHHVKQMIVNVQYFTELFLHISLKAHMISTYICKCILLLIYPGEICHVLWQAVEAVKKTIDYYIPKSTTSPANHFSVSYSCSSLVSLLQCSFHTCIPCLYTKQENVVFVSSPISPAVRSCQVRQMAVSLYSWFGCIFGTVAYRYWKSISIIETLCSDFLAFEVVNIVFQLFHSDCSGFSGG